MDNNLNLYKAKLPYPPIVVAKPNKHYAEIIQVNFAGAVSEFSAISQYPTAARSLMFAPVVVTT